MSRLAFDIIAYSKAFDSFVGKMNNFTGTDISLLGDAVRELCSVLRISRITEVMYWYTESSYKHEGSRSVIYDDGCADEDSCLSFPEKSEDGFYICHDFCRRKGDVDWDNEETAMINVLRRTLYEFERCSAYMTMAKYYSKEIGVFNMKYFSKTTDDIISAGNIGKYGACHFNLKRFSIVNQHIGRSRATNVMRSFVGQLQDKLGDNGYICRMSGDNFVVVFRKDYLDTVSEYLKGTSIAYDDKGQTVFISAYAGYYLIPDQCSSSDEILDSISIAVNSAKNVYKVNSVFFDEKLKRSRNEIKMVENDFMDSIEKEEFKVYYQPKVQLKSYTLNGAEALCRWIRNGQLIPPFRFIPALEQSKAICTLDFYMLDHVCRDIRRWLDEGREVVTVSVNFSRRHLGDGDLLERIISCIDKYNVPHRFIEIELTETTTDVDFDDLKKIVVGLRDAGISTAVDDFGIGYSSLNLIKELPWSALKIDKSFLPDETDMNTQKYAMLKHIIALVQDIGLECIVEGVETDEQVLLLKENNCYLAQGFYFDKPLPVGEYEKRLDDLKMAKYK
ncbi:MAG: EAL domain-containing protein [Huintestinicola sp.]